MVWRQCLVGLLLSAAAFDAFAQSRPERELMSEPVQGYAYYNRPDASLEEHDAEIRDCYVATNVRPNASAPTPSIATQLIWGGVIQAIGTSAIENCMIARGWRVFQLSEAEGRMVSRLSDADFTARFAPMVGAATPPGVLARRWDNQTARPARYHTPSRPRAQSRDQLSARSFRLKGGDVQLRTADEAAGPRTTGIRGMPLERATSPGPGKALIILRAIGSRNMGFARTLETGGVNAIGISGNREGVWQVFEVPAGRWRITHTSWMNHCLGAPAFDIAAGEVVYAGTFDLAGEALGPTLDLADLSGRLEAALGERLRAARYQNGSTVPCGYGGGIYPLEIPGAPFEAGYRWGSLASAGRAIPD